MNSFFEKKFNIYLLSMWKLTLGYDIMATQNVRSSLTIPIFDPYDDTNLRNVIFMYERQPSILTMWVVINFTIWQIVV
jgi:hypothetical protein